MAHFAMRVKHQLNLSPMQWRDTGILLSLRPHGETSAIVEMLTRAHGRHLGLARGGRSRRLRPTLQTGNSLNLTWRARLPEHLGNWTLECRRPRAAALMRAELPLAAAMSAAALCRLLPERDACPRIHDGLEQILAAAAAEDAANLPSWLADFVRWELELLREMGYGLALDSCALGGASADLAWVSPRSGRAVSAHRGQPYAPRLLPLPPFLRPHSSPDTDAPDVKDIIAGLDLTGHFLEKHAKPEEPQPLPPPRLRFAELLRRYA